MIQIEGRIARYGEIWLHEQLPAAPEVDVLIIRHRPCPVDGRVCSPSLTLVNDLTLDVDLMQKSMEPATRYEVRRAEKEGLELRHITDPRAHLEEFFDFYDAFARERAIETAYRRGLAAACDAGQLVLSNARRGGSALVWHSYVVYGNTATLLHSASHLSDKDAAARALTGRANRWLHWQDMLRFKQLGRERYDWGGLFEDESVPRHAFINRFKRQFGGTSEYAYDCTLPLTIKGRTLVAAREAIERVRKWSGTHG